ncbi:hypothetical protein MASR1M12_23980 [Erysipelotrichia bacterium]
MARGIDESDDAVAQFDLIGTDMLGDTAHFLVGDVRFADIVDQPVLPWST